MARRFAGAGDHVVLTYNRSRARAEALAASLGAEALHLDVSSEGDARAGVGAILHRHGRIDVLVNNAGVGLNRLIIDTTDSEYRQVMAVNAFGTFNMMRAVLPGMIERRDGAIINVASIWGQTGGANEAVYSASKAAVIGLTRAAAKEVAGAGIRVNCLAPGFIETAMNDHLDDAEKAALAAEIPLGRAGTPEDVAEAAFYLASRQASYITGQVLPVNGGWLI